MISFKKLIVHNFGSYGHAELALENKGFCLVSGQNNFVKDNALSNGSGKSFLWNAVCFALTGETLSGIKTNLKNINVQADESYVQLEFEYGKDFIQLTRIIAPKSDLKILKNDIDISGKGIRESDKILQEILPEISKDFIASTILIGQGMPNKFSSFSPSGRKELLEKLTNSDFMIEDIKNRIQARSQELTSKIREFEDSHLVNKNQLNSHLTTIEKLKSDLANVEQKDFDTNIQNQVVLLEELGTNLAQLQERLQKAEQDFSTDNAKLTPLIEEKAKVSAEELQAYSASALKLRETKAKQQAEVTRLTQEIQKLQSIVDTCPTCGQHLPNVCKPSTVEQEKLLKQAQEAYNKTLQEIAKCETTHQSYIQQINESFDGKIAELNFNISLAKSSISQLKPQVETTQNRINVEQQVYNKLCYDKQNLESTKKHLETEIAKKEAEVARLTNLISIITLSKEEFEQRLGIIKKMSNLTKRDFRGYLLTNIINFIDMKAKDYCETVFGTRDLDLALNGNSLDISYCNKPFDGLSGGEKQRVDLILQLAIRELLISYLGLTTNLLVLDEVTDFLDKKSCEAVMNLLEKELQTVESVFIISHHAEELELPIDSELLVVKNEQGISELH